MSVRFALLVYSGAVRKVALIPRPPGGSACGGSHCVARSRLGRLAPVRPRGAPQKQVDHRIASADFRHFAKQISFVTGQFIKPQARQTAIYQSKPFGCPGP